MTPPPTATPGPDTPNGARADVHLPQDGPPEGDTVRLRFDLSYDGAAFSGWARQPNRRTVQGVLETALTTILRLDAPITLTVAGRTDAGVHARGQVAHLDLPVAVADPALPSLARRLLRFLPDDIRIHAVTVAPDGFDARFSAVRRRYAYRLCDDPLAFDPLLRHTVVVHPRPLDVTAMNEAAAHLLGEHDFAAFCRRREGATTVRHLLTLDVARDADTSAYLTCTVIADAFCHSMVRALIGALLPVGDARRPPAWPAAVLSAGVRDSGVTVAPAHGLTLEEVVYPPEEQLAKRAVESRRKRVLGEG